MGEGKQGPLDVGQLTPYSKFFFVFFLKPGLSRQTPPFLEDRPDTLEKGVGYLEIPGVVSTETAHFWVNPTPHIQLGGPNPEILWEVLGHGLNFPGLIHYLKTPCATWGSSLVQTFFGHVTQQVEKSGVFKR